MKKKIKLLTSVLLLLIFLAGCQTMSNQEESNKGEGAGTNGSQETSGNKAEASEVVWNENLLDPNDPVTVKFYSYSAASPKFGTGFETLKNNFNNGPGKEKGVRVEYVMDDNNGAKVKADAKAGLPIDIIQGSFSNLGVYLADIEPASYESVFPKEEMDKHFKGIPEKALQLGVLDDKMYSLAFTFSTPMLYMNSTILEEAGLDGHTPPKDWEEMYDMCQQVKEKTGKNGLAFSETNSSGWITASVLKSNGAEVLSEDGKEVLFASQEGKEAMSIWKKFYEDGLAVGGSDTDIAQVFTSGDAAFMIQSTAIYSSTLGAAKEGGWTLDGFPMPGFNGKESIPTNSGAGILVKPNDEKKAQAIWEVIKYYTGDEGFTIITSEIGYLPLRPELANKEEYLKGYVEENPLIGRNIERLDDIERGPIWRGNRAAELKQSYLDMSTKVLTTPADVGQTMQEYQDLMNTMVE